MLELLIAIFYYAFWISLIGLTMVLFLMRLYRVIKQQMDIKKAIIVVLTPCSIGYFRMFNDTNTYNRVYRLFVIITFVITFISSLFTLYIGLGLNFI